MHDRGLARATTKEIAREAGYSEALLYKHFDDKQSIYLAVLKERIGGVIPTADLVGTGEVAHNVATIVESLMAFYVKSFPMSASIFSDRELLAQWRDSMRARGAGPQGPVTLVEHYLIAEQGVGRALDLNAAAISELLCGAAFQQAFLASFAGLDEIPDARAHAKRLVAAVITT